MCLHFHNRTELAKFYGIQVSIVYEHTYEDKPYIHAYCKNPNSEYGYYATFDIETGLIADGKFPLDKSELVQCWIAMSKEELDEVIATRELIVIPPLQYGASSSKA